MVKLLKNLFKWLFRPLKWLTKIFVDSNEKELRRLQPYVDRTNELEPEFQKLEKAEANPLADTFRQQIDQAVSHMNERISQIRTELAKNREQIQVLTFRLDIEKIIQANTASREAIIDFLDYYSKLENNFQSIDTGNFENRMASATANIFKLMELIKREANAGLELLDNAKARIEEFSKEPSLTQLWGDHDLKEKSRLIGDANRAKEDLLKAQLDLDLKESAKHLDQIQVALSKIRTELKKFTLDNLEAKTYEFKDIITLATAESQEEIDAAEFNLFRAPLIIEIFKARDNVIKALLALNEAEVEEKISVAQADLNDVSDKWEQLKKSSRDNKLDNPELSAQLQQKIRDAQQKVNKLSERLERIHVILQGNNKERVIEYARLELDDNRNEITQQGFENAKEQVQEYEKAVSDYKELPDTVVPGIISNLKKKKIDIEKNALNDILPEAFAAVREAANRVIKQRAFDVQLLGGVTLHLGKIAEMRTGEGKTLTATFPLYLNSLTGRGAHLVTVNDYLARFHAYWMGPIYHALGVSVASIYPMQNPDEHTPARIYEPDYDSGKENDPWRKCLRPISRKEAYQADITYGTAAEFGFDFLRDNMVSDLSQRVQRPLYYCIVDEVDNLLIDEARTPLIISAPDTESGLLYQKFAQLVTRLKRDEEYDVKEKEQSADLNEVGWDKVEVMLKRDGLLKSGDSLYNNGTLMHHLRNALSAKEFYKKDQRYVVENGEVIIVDEFTGRKMYGRRYSEGLHQAIEAKEHIKVQQETKTYATVTIQNYFRMYEKLGGMTGTAATEAEEFYKIYKLEVTTIPTNKPMIREDLSDQIYKTEEGKFKAVAREIKRLHEKEIPVLIGTVSIEKSVQLSDMLKRQGITCQVLNAKEHTKEASIIARAGEPGAVTVATNMAGRGVDIILGGAPDGVSEQEWKNKHEKIIQSGGLHIIGTERHEARRIDNQLRGRAGRQGDPGNSRFFVSLEDDIMRRFGGDRMKTVMGWIGMDEDTPIENKMITNMITDVQKRVEGYHFDVRKNLVEYDDVVNKHRELIYEERRKILSGADLKSNILDMVKQEIAGIIAANPPNRLGEEGDTAGMLAEINRIIQLPPDLNEEAVSGMGAKDLEKRLAELADSVYDAHEKQMGVEKMRLLERLVMLQIIDRLWVDHLTEMERMRDQANLNTMRQMRSSDAYKLLGSERYGDLKSAFQQEVAGMIFHVSITERKQDKAPQSPMEKAGIGSRGNSKPNANTGSKKVGRNDPCPCGSGRKYKHCHGK